MFRRPAGRPRRGPLPPGYERVTSPAGRWVVRPECGEAVRAGQADSLLTGEALRAGRPGAGRGRPIVLDLAGQRLVGKRALHGGLLGGILGDRYLGCRRLVHQLRLAEGLRHAGVPTPEVMLIGWRRILGPLCAQTILTRAIPEAQNLYEAARDDAPWRRRRVILEKSADLVRAMHDAGFRHADLNVTNLVIGRGPDGFRVHVVDLDGGRFLKRLGRGVRLANLGRLLRSYEKWIEGSFRLSAREEILFLRRYSGDDATLFRYLLVGLRRRRAWIRLRRAVLRRARPGRSTR